MPSAGKCSKIQHIVKLRQMLRRWRQKACRVSSSYKIPSDVPSGHVAVCVGSNYKRFVVRTTYLNHPVFRKLLVQAEETYGFTNQGPLSIPCDESLFEEILRFVSRSESKHSSSSHKHNLKPECDNIPFICNGCNEPGLGQKFRCHQCNYDLHLNCALAHSTTFHSFYQNCRFTFLKSAPRNHRCNACGRQVKGFAFRCKAQDYDLHPSCANLPPTIKGNGRIKLHLTESISVKSKCSLCGNTNSNAGPIGWSYLSTCKKYHFHVSCVKNAATEKIHNEYFGKIKIEKPDMGLTVIPSLLLTSQTDATCSWWKWKFRKYWKIAKVVLNMIISTVIGDPVGGVAALIQSLLSG